MGAGRAHKGNKRDRKECDWPGAASHLHVLSTPDPIDVSKCPYMAPRIDSGDPAGVRPGLEKLKASFYEQWSKSRFEAPAATSSLVQAQQPGRTLDLLPYCFGFRV